MNRAAVVSGVTASLPIVLVAVLANAWLAGGDDPNLALVALTFVVLLAGFMFAGFAAARASAEGTPLQHAAAGATATWAVVQAIAVVVRLARGDGISPVGIVFTGLLAASAGIVGGILATRVPNQERRT